MSNLDFQIPNEMFDLLPVYCDMVDDYAWYGKGDIFLIAKLARQLKRSYMDDIATSKMSAMQTSHTKSC